MANVQADPLTIQATLPLVGFLVGASISGPLTHWVRRAATRRGFVDHPGGHKGHDRPVALGGGIAVTLAVVLPICAAAIAARLFADGASSWLPAELARHLGGMVTKGPAALAICGSALVMGLMGLADDRQPLHPAAKLLVQLAIAVFLVIPFDLRLMSHLPYALSATLSVLWILTLTNSFNFLDNTDGLAAGVGMIAAAVFATTAAGAGQIFVPACCWLLAGALGGFLPFNFHPAKIFLGDAGSQVIGLLLAVFTILITFAAPAQGQRPLGVLAPLVVMAVPLYDTLSVIVLRRRSGDPVWAGDRRHFSHRLLQRGMGVRQAVLVIYLATLVTALPAMLLPTATWPLAWGIVLQTVLVVTLVALLESPAHP
jgi:UDP-GlcNAc:undecaprenyl-phosphate GlcNAc-1-phosphate transferase